MVRGPKLTLSHTVYQGKSAASWKTTPRLGSGASTDAPLTRTCPADGRSKPATMLRRVDLPQPEGPRMAANSLWAMLKSMSRSATTWRSRAANSLETPRSSTAASGMGLERAPAKQEPRGEKDNLVREEAEQSDGEHGGDADVHAPDVVGIPQNVAQS